MSALHSLFSRSLYSTGYGESLVLSSAASGLAWQGLPSTQPYWANHACVCIAWNAPPTPKKPRNKPVNRLLANHGRRVSKTSIHVEGSFRPCQRTACLFSPCGAPQLEILIAEVINSSSISRTSGDAVMYRLESSWWFPDVVQHSKDPRKQKIRRCAEFWNGHLLMRNRLHRRQAALRWYKAESGLGL